jgi:hypothetical protein
LISSDWSYKFKCNGKYKERFVTWGHKNPARPDYTTSIVKPVITALLHVSIKSENPVYLRPPQGYDIE